MQDNNFKNLTETGYLYLLNSGFFRFLCSMNKKLLFPVFVVFSFCVLTHCIDVNHGWICKRVGIHDSLTTRVQVTSSLGVQTLWTQDTLAFIMCLVLKCLKVLHWCHNVHWIRSVIQCSHYNSTLMLQFEMPLCWIYTLKPECNCCK